MKNKFIPHHSFSELAIDEQMATILNWSETPIYNFEEIHSHDFFDILIFIKGGGKHIIDFQEEIIKDYSIHIVSNRSTHRAIRTKKSDGFSLLLTPLYIEQLQQFDKGIDYTTFFSQSRIINFNKNYFNTFNFIFDELKGKQENRSYFLNTIASFLSKLVYVNKENILLKQPEPIVKRFINYLNDNFKNKDCITDFICIENISEVVFRRKIKSNTNKTPNQLLQEKVMIEAKKLLFITILSIKEIAYQLNFENESYFCKQFKKLEKITPNEFRKKVQKST
jgi:AraC-like DNA-binding protein